MAEIVPAVLAETAAEFSQKLAKVKFASRLHLDIARPPFTPNQTVGLAQISLPRDVSCDLHLMLGDPSVEKETIISLKPRLAIIHAEARGDLAGLMRELQRFEIKAGLALLPQTSVEEAAELIPLADHVLIFTGRLGSYGGEMQTDQLQKIQAVKKIKSDLEVSVDGGVNPENAGQAAAAGADILISGGFIVNADSPRTAYAQLIQAAQV